VAFQEKPVAIQIRRFQNSGEVEMSLNEELQKQMLDLCHQVDFKPTPSWGKCSNIYIHIYISYINI
jgi:hypothetical protein